MQPDRITFNAVYNLFEPPSELASTREWLKFRDEILRPLLAGYPHDPNLPNLLRQTNVILAWRETVAPEDRFWRSDSRPAKPKITSLRAARFLRRSAPTRDREFSPAVSFRKNGRPADYARLRKK